MRAINYRELRRRYELDGPQSTTAHLREALETRALAPDDFSLRELAEATLGTEWVRQLNPRSGGGLVGLLEASDGTDLTAFSNIAGQVVYSKVMEAYRHEAFVVSRLVATIPTRLDGEKIPGVGPLEDGADEVHPGMPYPNLGLTEDYIETPATTKRGFIVPVTKEALFFDRTHLILQRAAEVGEVLGLNKEKRLIDAVIGAVKLYNWKGTQYETYQTAAPWINVLADNALVDWTNVDAAEQLFADMLDPATGEPVLIQPNTVLVTPAARHAAHRVFKASEIRYAPVGGDASATASNPFTGYQVADSRLLYRRIVALTSSAADAKTWWFVGDFRRAFAYMENWPITITQAPAGGEAEFSQDIVLRFKASERGAAAVLNPRYVVKCTG